MISCSLDVILPDSIAYDNALKILEPFFVCKINGAKCINKFKSSDYVLHVFLSMFLFIKHFFF